MVGTNLLTAIKGSLVLQLGELLLPHWVSTLYRPKTKRIKTCGIQFKLTAPTAYLQSLELIGGFQHDISMTYNIIDSTRNAWLFEIFLNKLIHERTTYVSKCNHMQKVNLNFEIVALFLQGKIHTTIVWPFQQKFMWFVQ